ncbi:hypothetical protein [Paraburkholderia kirstenboschensis]|uniref:Uncharacterized protein n=1 Tax=Paraburkholderia kirstenboschensis TaxID=1245436 RepID=A0ABZ0ETV9_9BURK|nr:hypothetical protein [Paraburkholderia kirstenboschensis]WOD20608.1 hypothetical protein RW095_31045 [Paraburkholderia kirstenboschensis]
MKIIQSGTSNTLCPYLAKPLSDGFDTNKEHILPVALGAPESFFIVASASENTRLNDLVDAPMINDPAIKMLSVLAEVKTRSGRKIANMHGTTAFGDEFIADVTKDSVALRFRSPVIKDEKTGEIIGVKGFGDSVFEEARKISDRMISRGREVQIGGPIVMLEDKSPVEMSIVSDQSLMRRESIKAAYLLTVKAYGDAAITSKSGQIFRAAIEADTEEALTMSGLHWRNLPADHYKLEPALKAKHHMLFTSLKDDWLFSQVVLFGGISFAFWTPRDDIDQSNCFYGKIIDASRGRFINRPEEQE